jgi:hypothetical protein
MPAPSPISGSAAHRAAVVEVLQDRQPLLDDRVALAALDVRHEAHAAGVVFVAGVVQTLRKWLAHRGDFPRRTYPRIYCTATSWQPYQLKKTANGRPSCWTAKRFF